MSAFVILKSAYLVLCRCFQNFGGRVRVVLGEWRDHEGRLEGLDEAQYCVHVILTSGPIFKARPNLGQYESMGDDSAFAQSSKQQLQFTASLVFRVIDYD